MLHPWNAAAVEVQLKVPQNQNKRKLWLCDYSLRSTIIIALISLPFFLTASFQLSCFQGEDKTEEQSQGQTGRRHVREGRGWDEWMTKRGTPWAVLRWVQNDAFSCKDSTNSKQGFFTCALHLQINSQDGQHLLATPTGKGSLAEEQCYCSSEQPCAKVMLNLFYVGLNRLHYTGDFLCSRDVIFRYEKGVLVILSIQIQRK